MKEILDILDLSSPTIAPAHAFNKGDAKKGKVLINLV